MQRGEPSPQSNQNFERRRRTQSKYNKDAPRYECFCSKQYLSYPALYLHMKNKHVDYFQNSKSGRVQPTKLIESFNAADGFKIYKIANDSLHKQLYAGKYNENYMDNKVNYFGNPNGNYIRLLNMGYPQYSFANNGSNQIDEKKDAVIEIALSMYMQTIKDKQIKQKYQTQLFFVMIVDCINKNYQLLKDSRTDSQEVKRYTAQYNCQKMMEILPYFQTQYLPSLADPSKPTFFFVKYSYIITSGEYKNVLKAFISYIDDKIDKSQLRKIIEAPLPSFSEQQAEVASEQVSQKDEPQDGDEDDGEEFDENEYQYQDQS